MSNLAPNSTSPFPVLEEMGIARAHEMSFYKLRPDGADKGHFEDPL